MSTLYGLTPRRAPTAGRWLAVILWIALIYTAIPFVRTIQRWFTARWDKALIGYIVMIVVVLAAVCALLGLRRLSRRPTMSTVVWVLAIAALYVWWAASLRRVPEEAVHLLEYGVLGILLYRALRPGCADASIYLVAALVGVLVGTVDEIIQWITPGRFWEFRDVFLNSGSSGLALAAVWRIEGSPKPVEIPSVRRVLSLAAVVMLLFTLCLSMTPLRVQRFAQTFPGIWFLQSPDNEMAEYGYRHVIAGVGTIKSRFTIQELEDADASRGAEAARIIEGYPDERYGEFLRDYPSHRDPFVHEARVHIFSRDHHLADRDQQHEGSDEFHYHATVALRQHQILETLFANTLRTSTYRLESATVEELQRQQLSALLWASSTSRHLITWISERALRRLLITLIIVVAVVDVWLGLVVRQEVANHG